jgi:hypothetical protein
MRIKAKLIEADAICVGLPWVSSSRNTPSRNTEKAGKRLVLSENLRV